MNDSSATAVEPRPVGRGAAEHMVFALAPPALIDTRLVRVELARLRSTPSIRRPPVREAVVAMGARAQG